MLLPYAEEWICAMILILKQRPFGFDMKRPSIWTPGDYDKNAAEKYSTIYLFDGQTVPHNRR